jgi:signal transduction histidine kinase
VPRLIVIKGADVGKQFDLTANAGVGRDASNAVRLHDTEASRRHAEFRRDADGTVRLIDLGSANGTFVNTRPVQAAVLQSGDHIQIGQTILVYTAGRGETSMPADLADRIRMISRQDESPSAIVKTIGDAEGSRILAAPESAASPWLQSNLANLAVVYETIQAVSHILEIDPLLERIMDLICRSIDADRGCIMLRNPDTGAFEPKAVRLRDRDNTHETIGISRTIMEYVLREKEGVLVSDAARDDRFKTGQSIVRLGIREALCVPMKGRHETVGVMYLDTAISGKDVIIHGEAEPAGRFTEDHLALAIAIAHQAALAVEETRYHQALVHAERLAAVGQTIAAVSHHIKNILQGLRSGSDLLKMGLTNKDEELLTRGWRIVEKNQGKIYDLVLDMLSYSKEREPAIEPTDLNLVVEEVVELLRGRAEEQGVQVELRLSRTLTPIQADPEGVHRALLNVVGNAFDAVADCEEPHIIIQTLVETNGEWAKVIVLDNGPGIPPDKLDDIFRPFVSSKGSKGTGLGLPVSRKILREHGGDLQVQSQLGTGSKFTLRLPVRSPLSPDMANTMHDTPPLPPS